MFDQAEEQLREVADDDEGWSECWPAVVLHNQVVPLKLPEDICVSLHYLKRVTGRTHAVLFFFLLFLKRFVQRPQISGILPEHGNEQV